MNQMPFFFPQSRNNRVSEKTSPPQFLKEHSSVPSSKMSLSGVIKLPINTNSHFPPLKKLEKTTPKPNSQTATRSEPPPRTPHTEGAVHEGQVLPAVGGDQEVEEGSSGWVGVPALGGLSRGLRRVSSRGQLTPHRSPEPVPGAGPRGAAQRLARRRSSAGAEPPLPRTFGDRSTFFFGFFFY